MRGRESVMGRGLGGVFHFLFDFLIVIMVDGVDDGDY